MRNKTIFIAVINSTESLDYLTRTQIKTVQLEKFKEAKEQTVQIISETPNAQNRTTVLKKSSKTEHLNTEER